MKKTFFAGLIFSCVFFSIFIVRMMKSNEIEELPVINGQELIMQDEEVGSVQATLPQFMQYAQLYQKMGNKAKALRMYAMAAAYKNRVVGQNAQDQEVEQDEELSE